MFLIFNSKVLVNNFYELYSARDQEVSACHHAIFVKILTDLSEISCVSAHVLSSKTGRNV